MLAEVRLSLYHRQRDRDASIGHGSWTYDIDDSSSEDDEEDENEGMDSYFFSTVAAGENGVDAHAAFVVCMPYIFQLLIVIVIFSM